MTVGILIISHQGIGNQLFETAITMLEVCPLETQVLPVDHDCDPDQVENQAQAMLDKVNSGDGVLVLTDIYGSTPSNIACRLIEQNNVIVVAGMNLPMLIRVLNYPRLQLNQLADKAISGGKDGILCSQQTQQWR